MHRSTPMASPLRVVLVEDHTLLRSFLRSTLTASPDVVVVGEAATGAEGVRLVRTVRPDVLVLDVQLAGGIDGVEVAAYVADGDCRVLAFSSHSDPVHVAHLLRAGAAGFLSKEAPVSEIVTAVRAVAAGESRWFAAGLKASALLTPDESAALAFLAGGGGPDGLGAGVLDGLLGALGASSWYEALANGWGLGLVRSGRSPVGEPDYSIRSKRPGQAIAASAGSYGA